MTDNLPEKPPGSSEILFYQANRRQIEAQTDAAEDLDQTVKKIQANTGKGED